MKKDEKTAAVQSNDPDKTAENEPITLYGDTHSPLSDGAVTARIENSAGMALTLM